MKIVITDCQTITNGDIDISLFEKYGKVTYYMLTSNEQIAERIKDADVVLCNKTQLNESNLKEAKNLKYIGLFATGYNNIDIDYATKRGITVCNAGSYSTKAVAQHTFAFILNHYSRVADYNIFVDSGSWMKNLTFSPFVFPMEELFGKTIGIVGYGSIGQEVAKIANAFSMNVLVYTRTPKNDSTVTFTDLITLVEKSHIVTVHCPLNNASYKMFNKELFSRFKRGAFFINTSRGAVVDEEALQIALNIGKLSGAGIDVLETEPMSSDCRLYKAKNIVITPHVAWAPTETRKRLVNIVAENLECFINGSLKNAVNKI